MLRIHTLKWTKMTNTESTENHIIHKLATSDTGTNNCFCVLSFICNKILITSIQNIYKYVQIAQKRLQETTLAIRYLRYKFGRSITFAMKYMKRQIYTHICSRRHINLYSWTRITRCLQVSIWFWFIHFISHIIHVQVYKITIESRYRKGKKGSANRLQAHINAFPKT